MPRNLNSRQMQFAASVAAGKLLAVAYREAYRPANDKAPSVYQNAKRSAKHPGIAARIKELQLELLPAPEDMKAVYSHGLATIIHLSISCEDSRVRLNAARWLCAEAEKQAEKRQALGAGRTLDQREEIIDELRALYRKALPEQEPLVVEVREAAHLPQVAAMPVEVAAGDELARAEDEAREPGEPATVEVSLVAEKLNPPVQFRLERVPGYFPARYRRVPIQP